MILDEVEQMTFPTFIMSRSGATLAPGVNAGAMMDTMHYRSLTTRSCTVRAGSIDEDARTVRAQVATDQVVQVFDWDNFRVIDEVLRADGAQLPAQVPMLESHLRHTTEYVLGSARDLARTENGVSARLHFAAGTDERAQRAWEKVRDGHVTDVSVGYRVERSEVIEPGESRDIAGTTYKAEARTLRVATAWRAVEVSLVPIGADDAAKIRAWRGAQHTQENTTMPERLRKYLESIGLRAGATEAQAWEFHNRLDGEQAEQARSLERDADLFTRNDPGNGNGENVDDNADGDAGGGDSGGGDGEADETTDAGAERAATVPPMAARDAVQDALRQDRQRVAEIRQLGRHVAPELVERAEMEGWSVGRASREFLAQRNAVESAAVGAGTARSDSGRSTMDQARLAMTAGLIVRMGMDPTERMPVRGVRDPQLVAKIRQRAANDAGRYEYMTLRELSREILSHAANGGTIPHNPHDMIREAMSTASFDHVFTDSVNARVDQAFEEAEDTSVQWTETGDVSDFKLNRDITMGATKGMKKLPRGGAADHATIDDEAEFYSAHRYAEQFIVDEQDVFDDMLNLLQNVPMEMGEDAAQLRPNLVYSILLANPTLNSGVALFSAGHSNLNQGGAGAAGALQDSSLKDTITAMGKQRREGRPLNIPARFLIVPKDEEFNADQLINSAEVRNPAASGQEGTLNTIRGRGLVRVSDDRLGVQGVTDPNSGNTYLGTATNWFLATTRRTIRVVYVSGTGRRPTVRRFVLDRGQYGIGWDIKLDIGAYVQDYRGLQKNDGA